jgi:hypothetical protein
MLEKWRELESRYRTEYGNTEVEFRSSSTGKE